MSLRKGFSTTIGVLLAITIFPALVGIVWVFMCAGLFTGAAILAPKDDPALKNLPVAQRQAAGEWDKRVAREKEREAAKAQAELAREVNAEIRAQRRRPEADPLMDKPAAEDPAPHEPDFDGPEAIVDQDGGRAREAAKRAEEAKVEADAKSDEEKAENLLKAARPLLEVNRKAGRKRLQEILDKYPGTIAAAAARDLLKK
jgi:hypothetical protein